MTDLNLDRDDDKIEDIYKLVKDNNRMLHSMRRGAFLNGLAKFVIYALMVGVSLWAYVTYVGPLLATVLKQITQFQSAATQAQEQVGGVQAGAAAQLKGVSDTLNTIQSQLKSLPATQ